MNPALSPSASAPIHSTVRVPAPTDALPPYNSSFIAEPIKRSLDVQNVVNCVTPLHQDSTVQYVCAERSDETGCVVCNRLFCKGDLHVLPITPNDGLQYWFFHHGSMGHC